MSSPYLVLVTDTPNIHNLTQASQTEILLNEYYIGYGARSQIQNYGFEKQALVRPVEN